MPRPSSTPRCTGGGRRRRPLALISPRRGAQSRTATQIREEKLNNLYQCGESHLTTIIDEMVCGATVCVCCDPPEDEDEDPGAWLCGCLIDPPTEAGQNGFCESCWECKTIDERFKKREVEARVSKDSANIIRGFITGVFPKQLTKAADYARTTGGNLAMLSLGFALLGAEYAIKLASYAICRRPTVVASQ